MLKTVVPFVMAICSKSTSTSNVVVPPEIVSVESGVGLKPVLLADVEPWISALESAPAKV